MDARRARLWQAMGLGPVWVARARADAAAEVAVADETRQSVAPTPPPSPSPASGGGSNPFPRTAGEGGGARDGSSKTDVRDGAIVRLDTPSAGRAAQIAALDWPALEDAVRNCTACPLCRTRKQTVFGVGHRGARWMLVGEAPGAEEDARGEPFVGQAGKLLDNMLAAVDLMRAGETSQSVYIANVLKCRPPGNRNPEPTEVALCEPYLLRQVELVQPDLLLVMGRFAAQSLLRTDATIASLRGRVHRVQVAGREIPTVVTYHPAYLLRNLADKAKSWADLCLAASVVKTP
ncbi:MAG: uracil-DNA glycosylase family protein [Betaproteobacteria bacterium]